MKAKHILLMIAVSAVTSISAVMIYAKFAAPRNVSSFSSNQLPANYAGFF